MEGALGRALFMSTQHRSRQVSGICALALASVFFIGGKLSAQTVIDSHPYVTGGSFSVYRIDAGGGSWTAQRLTAAFSTGSTAWDLSSVKLTLQLGSGSLTGYTAAIYTSGSNNPANASFGPASSLVSLTFPSVSTQALYTFSPVTGATLAANTTYWITLTPSLTTFAELYWFRSAGTLYDGSSGANTSPTFSAWSVTNTNAPLTFEVYGTAIPEPSSYAAFAGLVAVMTTVFFRRRSQNSSATN